MTRIRYRPGHVFQHFTTAIILLTLFYLVVKYFTLGPFFKEEKLDDFSPLVRDAHRSLEITILVVLNHASNADEYSYPLKTLRCYALQNRYNLKIVKDSDYSAICKQKDYMFRRHCVAAEVLKETDWLLFLDADIAVVNPGRLIEEYIDKSSYLTFYDRFTSWEIAMGSYIAFRDEWTISFLRDFADYEKRLPASFHGTDNGAIHAFIVERLLPHSVSKSAGPCFDIWHHSTGFPTLFMFEACMRMVIGDRLKLDRLRIVPKGQGWVRDIWLTNSEWSPERDFMLHGLKTSDRASVPTGPLGRLRSMFWSRFTWYPPIEEQHLDLKSCAGGDAVWQYDNRLRVSKQSIETRFSKIRKQVEREKYQSLAGVTHYL